MIEFYRNSIKDTKLKKIDKFLAGCWINVYAPTKQEIDYLVEEFNLDKDNLLSGLDQHEIPRADFIDGVTYIYIKAPFGKRVFSVKTLLIVISDKFILTLSDHSPEYLKDIISQKLRVNIITTQRKKFLLHVLNINNKEIEKKTLEIVKSIETKKRITKELKEKDINEMIEHEYSLNILASVYSYTNYMYSKIIHRMGFFEKDKDILEELMIATEEGEHLCKTSLKNISNIRNYSMVLLSMKLNKLISVLTVFTVFLSVIASISSIYGMNIKLPFQNDSDAFLYIITIIATIWLLIVWYLKRERIF